MYVCVYVCFHVYDYRHPNVYWCSLLCARVLMTNLLIAMFNGALNVSIYLSSMYVCI